MYDIKLVLCRKITFVIRKIKKLPPPKLHSLTPICIKRAYIAPTEDSQLYSGGGLLIKAGEGKEGTERKGRGEGRGLCGHIRAFDPR